MKYNNKKAGHGFFYILFCLFAVVHESYADPEVPEILRSVNPIEDGQFKAPYLPALKLSVDGRIGVSHRPAGGSGFMVYLLKPENIESDNKDFLELPPKNSPLFFSAIDRHVFVENDGSVTIKTAADVFPERELDPGVAFIRGGNLSSSLNMASLCETEDPAVGFTKNPYACTVVNNVITDKTQGLNDCYDLTLIGAEFQDFDKNSNGTASTRMERFGSRSFTVSVANPKTKNAYIETIELDAAPIYGSWFRSNFSFEPAMTGDGKVIIFRMGTDKFAIDADGSGHVEDAELAACETDLETIGEARDSGNGNPNCPFIDVVYSYNSNPASHGCDVNEWDDVFPISHAHFDSELDDGAGGKKYGFAEYQLRAPDGTYIADNTDARGSYPWIDREGANISLTIGGAELHNGSSPDATAERFIGKTRCIDKMNCILNKGKGIGDINNGTWGVAIAGLWTQGKMVFVDNLLNNTDFGLSVHDMKQLELQMYEDDGTGRDWVRLGAGRQSTTKQRGDGWPTADTTNTDFFESVINRYNFQDEFKPGLFRDIVWKVQNGKAVEDFAFDDYMHPGAYIVSTMVGAKVNAYPDRTYKSPATSTPRRELLHYFDGWDKTLSKFTAERTRVENSATALAFEIPAYGQAINHGAGSGDDSPRIEPAALGGVIGRGFWFEEDYALSYAPITTPSNLPDEDRYVGLFVDPRFADDNISRRLITFPDGSSIRVRRNSGEEVGVSHIELYDPSNALKQAFDISSVLDVALSHGQRWVHLGFRIKADLKSVELFVNGFVVGEWSHATEMLFDMEVSGSIVLGATSASNGFKGWVDDFKVIFGLHDAELMCNHANGTVIGVDKNSPIYWKQTARIYGSVNANAFDEITTSLQNANQQFFSEYACFHDYTKDYAAIWASVPKMSGARAGESYSLRHELLVPEGTLYHDAPRPNTLSNEFCISCHHVNAKGGLKIGALASNTLFNAEDDPRRQPTQQMPRLQGNIPANWLGLGNPSLSLSIGNFEYSDRYYLGSATGDNDGDGITDDEEVIPGIDGFITDPGAYDTDNDGISDSLDASPLVPDHDGDGIESGVDGDDDGDLTPDVSDAFPLDPAEYQDSDGDGVGDNGDAFPSDPGEWLDSDGDGVGDNLDADDDNDGVLDLDDALPNLSSEYIDTDGDGAGDSIDIDDDNDSILDVSDNCPRYVNPGQLDFDFDGEGDKCDSDDDDDGIPDGWEFSYGMNPYDASDKNLDTDYDGLDAEGEYLKGSFPDVKDTDGDGRWDDVDVFALDPSEWSDLDGDGMGDNADACDYTVVLTVDFDGDGCDDLTEDSDDDGDGVVDLVDAFPLDSTEWKDTDADGIGNNADPNDDNDSLLDSEELALGSNSQEYFSPPYVAASDVYLVGVERDSALGLPYGYIWSAAGGGLAAYGTVSTSLIDMAVSDSDFCTLDATESACLFVGQVYASSSGVKVEVENDHLCMLTEAPAGIQCKNIAGNPDPVETALPSSFTDPSDLSVGLDAACAVDDGEVECWGAVGGANHIPSAPALASGEVATAVAVGDDHVCAIVNGGGVSVKCWGDSNTNKLNIPVTADSALWITAGANHTCVVNGDYLIPSGLEVLCWGDNAAGQTSVPIITNPARVEAGGDQTCVSQAGGVDLLSSMTCWPAIFDTDGDGLDDGVDTDDDGDGVEDSYDLHAADPSRAGDHDNDGIDSLTDTDDDGDEYLDSLELSEGSDPYSSTSKPLDTDGDLNPNSTDLDDDNDGLSDSDEGTYGTDPLNILNPNYPNLFTVFGSSAGHKLGESISGAGDVNADGYPDFIVGSAYSYARVYSGVNGAMIYEFSGTLWDHFGISVSAAGDVNNDGYDDVIVGGHKSDISFPDAGVAKVFSGVDGAELYSFTGAATGDELGFSVSGAGDVNNDGYDDLIVGAAYSDVVGPSAGRAYVYSGLNGSALYTLDGKADYDKFGYQVSDAGDMNADGYDDFAVASWSDDTGGADMGAVYVYSGFDGGVIYTFIGDGCNTNYCYPIDAAGDVNNDGYDDLIFGSWLNDRSLDANPSTLAASTNTGAAWVYGGSDGALLYKFVGDTLADYLGSAVSGAGDVNGDGYDDVVVGAYGHDGQANMAGSARVYSGADGLILYTFTGDSSQDRLGYSVSGLGDVDKDGYSDVVIGIRYDDNGASNTGAARVFSGGMNFIDVSPANGIPDWLDP